jgi:AraC family transcriptional regulator of arabinose operon
MTGYFNCRDEHLDWVEGNLKHWNAYFTLRGTGEVCLPGERLNTAVGEFLLFPPGVSRSYRIPNPKHGWEFYWLHFRATPRLKNTLDWFGGNHPWQRHLVADVSLRVRLASILAEVHQINLVTPELPGREAILEAMLEALVLRIAAAETQEVSSISVDPRIANAMENFHRDIAAPGGVNELAKVAGLSRSQFSLLFRQGTGRTPQQYVEERRLEMAAYYLRTTALSVTEVSAMVGFENPFYFSNRFRRRFQKSPTQYRAGG